MTSLKSRLLLHTALFTWPPYIWIIVALTPIVSFRFMIVPLYIFCSLSRQLLYLFGLFNWSVWVNHGQCSHGVRSKGELDTNSYRWFKHTSTFLGYETWEDHDRYCFVECFIHSLFLLVDNRRRNHCSVCARWLELSKYSFV